MNTQEQFITFPVLIIILAFLSLVAMAGASSGQLPAEEKRAHIFQAFWVTWLSGVPFALAILVRHIIGCD